MKTLLTLCFGAVLTLTSCGSKQRDHPIEVGPATFLRDFDEAAALAKKSEKPIFAFFQEVPG